MKVTVSDESINRYGFRILTAGIQTAGFEKNPVMFYGHETRSLPIGKWTGLAVENQALTAVPEFDEDDPEAIRVKGKWDKQILNAASVGILPLEWSDEDDMKLPGQTGPTVTKCNLMEISIVGVGGNEAAVRLYAPDGKLLASDEALNLYFKEHKTPVQMDAQKVKELEAKVTELEAENSKLAGQLAEQETAALQLQAENLVSAAVAEGKVAEAQKPQFIELAVAKFDSVKKMIDEMPVQQNGQSHVATMLSAPQGSAVPVDRSGWTLTDWQKKDAAGLLQLKADNPEAFADILKTAKK